MNITLRDGRKLSGTPLQIVQGMRSVAFSQSDASIDEYIAWVADNVQRGDGEAITVSGSSDDEKAASLIAELKRIGFAQ